MIFISLIPYSFVSLQIFWTQLSLSLKLTIIFRIWLFIYLGCSTEVYSLISAQVPHNFFETVLSTTSADSGSGAGENPTPPTGNNIPPDSTSTNGDSSEIYREIKRKLILQNRENSQLSISKGTIYANHYSPEASLNSLERSTLVNLVRYNSVDTPFRVVAKPIRIHLGLEKVVRLRAGEVLATTNTPDVWPSWIFINYFSTAANI